MFRGRRRRQSLHRVMSGGHGGPPLGPLSCRVVSFLPRLALSSNIYSRKTGVYLLHPAPQEQHPLRSVCSEKLKNTPVAPAPPPSLQGAVTAPPKPRSPWFEKPFLSSTPLWAKMHLHSPWRTKFQTWEKAFCYRFPCFHFESLSPLTAGQFFLVSTLSPSCLQYLSHALVLPLADLSSTWLWTVWLNV